MKKIWIVLIIVFGVLAISVGLIYYLYFMPVNFEASGVGGVPVNVTKENFVTVFEANQFVKLLPSDAVVSLKMGEEYYTIRKSSVEKEKAEEYDFQISLPESYIPRIGSLCSAVQDAKSRGEMGFESGMSASGLMWKYRGMIKYRQCFGF